MVGIRNELALLKEKHAAKKVARTASVMDAVFIYLLERIVEIEFNKNVIFVKMFYSHNYKVIVELEMFGGDVAIEFTIPEIINNIPPVAMRDQRISWPVDFTLTNYVSMFLKGELRVFDEYRR